MSADGPPAGYVRVHAARWRSAVTTLAELEDDAHAMLREGTLYDSAANAPAARRYSGRGVVYGVALPCSAARVVVRHNQHGGLLAAVTGDVFLAPTRAPYELATSLALAERGVRTPPVVMYGVQQVLGPWMRSDVVTGEIENAADLSTYMRVNTSPDESTRAWSATRDLLVALGSAGVRHHDLNVKNVLLSTVNDALVAWILDVDRVTLGAGGDPALAAANRARLLRSARKWRDERGAVFDERELMA